jgi:carboxyl-terminal processing protease
VERGIVGRELECAVLGNEAPMASLPCEILPSREFYDYEDKYLLDRAQTQVPADLPPEKDRRSAPAGRGMLPRGGMRGHGARGFPAGEAATGKLYINEINTIPGLHLHQHVSQDVGAQRAGLSPGDEIVVVNNVPLAALSFEQLVQYLGESHQKQAELLVRRPGSVRPLKFTLSPELIDAPSVDRAFLLQPGIGYVRVASFDPQTAKLLKDAIEKLGGPKLKGLVLDLRNNTGGVVQTALLSASYFLKPGQRILTAHGRSLEGKQEMDVPKNAVPYSFPLAVLVNEKTASAAEIVTGAMQDHDRATIVGVTTYGKGLVQSVLPLSGNTAMALTTAFYYTPSGRSIQKPLREGQLGDIASHTEYSTDSGRKVPGGGGIQPDLVVPPEGQNRLRVALEASGTLTSFATEYTQKHKLTEPFDVTPALLDDFHLYASERAIQPSVPEWLRERDWIQGNHRRQIHARVVQSATISCTEILGGPFSSGSTRPRTITAWSSTTSGARRS